MGRKTMRGVEKSTAKEQEDESSSALAFFGDEMKKVEVIFDFNKPEEARKFLSGLKSKDGRHVTSIHLANGSNIDLDFLTDEEAMDTASEIYTDWYLKGAVIWEPAVLQ